MCDMFQYIVNEDFQRCLRNTCTIECVNQLLPECVCSLFIVNILFIINLHVVQLFNESYCCMSKTCFALTCCNGL